MASKVVRAWNSAGMPLHSEAGAPSGGRIEVPHLRRLLRRMRAAATGGNWTAVGPCRCLRVPELPSPRPGALGRQQRCTRMQDATNTRGATPPCTKQQGQKQQHSPWSAPRQRKRRPPAQQVAQSLQSLDEDACWTSPPKRLNGEEM